jgi:hypothetical protein
MKPNATSLLVQPAVKRLAGEQPSRWEAAVAAVSAAAAAGVLVYRLLRSHGEQGEAEA